MGITYTKSWDFSPIIPIGPDLYRLYLVNRIYKFFLGIFVASWDDLYDTYDFTQYTSPRDFNISSTTEDIPVCVFDTNLLCTSVINNITLNGEPVPKEQVYITRGTTSCNTLQGRSGSIVFKSLPPDLAQTGYLCKVQVGDWPQTPDNRPRCCKCQGIDFSQLSETDNMSMAELYNKFKSIAIDSSCPVGYSNGFTSDDCNDIMQEYCSEQANTPECIFFTLASIYSHRPVPGIVKYCSKYLPDKVCRYAALASRTSGQSFMDDPLRIYCQANPNSKNCKCYQTTKQLPSSFQDNVYMGPIACWYKPCAEITQPQFLLQEQWEQRNNCLITICNIDIQNILIDTANPTQIDLIQKCNNQPNITAKNQRIPRKYYAREITLAFIVLLPLIMTL